MATRKTEEQLTTEFNVIRNETTDGANTKGRVADALDNMNVSKVGKLSLQESTPTAPADTIDGAKIFVDTNSNLGLVKRDGNNQIITSETQMLNTIGDIVNDYFDRASTGFTLTGANISQAIASNKWRITNTTGNTAWVHFAEIDYTTWLWNYDYSVKLNNITNGNGLGIGFKQASGGGNGIRVDLSAGANRGKLYLVTFDNSGVETILQTSVAVSFTNTTDELYLCLRRDGYYLYGELVNVTTDGIPVIVSQVSDLTSNAVEAFGIHSNLCVFSFGGVQDVSNLNLRSSQKRKHKLAIVGDSNSIGRNSAASLENVYSQLFGNTVHGDTVIYSAAGAKLTDFEDNIQEFVNLIDVDEVFLALGTNDSGASLASASFLASLDNVIEILHAKGCKIILATVAPTSNSTRNSTYIVPYNSGISARSTRAKIIDLYTLLVSGGLLNVAYDRDGVHYNELAHIAIYNLLATELTRLRRNINYPLTGSIAFTQIDPNDTRGFIVSNSTVQTALNTESGWTNGVKTGISDLLAGQIYQGQNLTDTNKRYGYACFVDGSAYRWLIAEAVSIETIGLIRPNSSKSGNYTITANDEWIEFTATATCTLPTPSSVTGQLLVITTGSASATVTFTGTINGGAITNLVGSYQTIQLRSNGTEFRKVN